MRFWREQEIIINLILDTEGKKEVAKRLAMRFLKKKKVGGFAQLETRYQDLNERDFPGGPVAKTPSSQCKGPGFDPWSGN